MGQEKKHEKKQGKHPSTFLNVAMFIIVMEVCERLTYYGMSTNMVIYLWTYLGFNKGDATAMKMAWTGICYTAPLIGSICADSFFGRYNVIKWVGMFYTLGVIIICISTLPFYNEVTLYPDEPNEAAKCLYFIGAYIIALGTGGIKACVSTLGADQFDENDEQDRAERATYFTWFMIAVQIGGFVGGFFPELMEQLEYGFPIGYGIAAGLMVCAMIAFFVGSSRYKKNAPAGSEILEAAKTFGSAVARQLCPSVMTSSATPASSRNQESLSISSISSSSGYQKRDPIAEPCKATSVHDEEEDDDEDDKTNWMMAASTAQGGPFSKQAARDGYQMWRLLPLFTTQIGFCLVYIQTNETFIVQGVQMDDRSYRASTLAGTADPVLCMVFMLAVQYIMMPLCKRCGWELTTIRKMGLSIVCGILTCVYMAVLEYARRGSPVIQEYRDGLYAPMHELTVFAQLPGYALASLGQAFAWVGSLQFFYDESPPQFKAIATSLNTLATAFASYLSMALVLIIQAATKDEPWIAENADDGHLDWYFFLCAGLNVINLVWFFVAYRLYLNTGGFYAEVLARREARKEERRRQQYPCQEEGYHNKRPNIV